MDLPEQLKATTAQTYTSREAAKSLNEEARLRKFSQHTKVEAKYLEGLRKEVRSGDLIWYSDASKYVGGKGESPSALQHFLAGLPLCQMTHYAERASVSNIRLESLKMSVTGHFTAMPGYGYDEITWETRIQSPEPAETIQQLAKQAEADCYVTNTLKRACKLTGRIYLNGEFLAETHPI